MEAREVLPGIDDSITVTATREEWDDVLIDLGCVDERLERYSEVLRILLKGLM